MIHHTKTSLLERVLEAHGGLGNWSRTKTLSAQMSLGGMFWASVGWPEVYASQTATLDPHREHIELTPFTAPDRTSIFDVNPERVAIVTSSGQLIEERVAARSSFPLPFELGVTRWDALQVAYFTSAAVWNYLTEPFVFTYPGVEAAEIEPWEENGETWRRLAVSFPTSIANHNRDQVFYYDASFMQRRMDYAPDVTSGPPVAHYTYDPKTFDGFVFPTRRVVHLHDHGIADKSFASITLDIASISIGDEPFITRGSRA